MHDLVRPATRKAIREALVGDYINALEELFQDHGYPPGADPPQTLGTGGRWVVQRYLNGITWSDRAQVARLCPIVEYALRRSPEDQNLRAELARDGFRIDGDPPTVTHGALILSPDALADLRDPSAVEDHLRRMQATVTTDPRTTVATAQALVESVAKIVLRERGQGFSDRDDVLKLARAAQVSLRLTREDVATDPRAGEGAKHMLSALLTLVQGVSEFRNRGGIAHGAESVPAWVQPRHASLVAGAAQLWCQFLLDTLRDPKAPWRKVPTASTNSAGSS